MRRAQLATDDEQPCEPWLFVLRDEAENYFVPKPRELGRNGNFAVFKMIETDAPGGGCRDAKTCHAKDNGALQFSKPRPTRTCSRELSYMNPYSKDDSKSNHETQALDPPLIHEEEVVHPALDDDEKASAEKSKPAQIGEDKERAEMVTKEAMLRVTGGQL